MRLLHDSLIKRALVVTSCFYVGGHASIPLFIATDQVVYGPIMRLSSHSVRNTLSRLAYLPTSRKHQEELLECMNGNQSNSHAISIEAVGVIYLRYSVLES